MTFFSFKNVEKISDDYALAYVSQHKHLGLFLPSNLNLSHYIDPIVKKAYKNLI